VLLTLELALLVRGERTRCGAVGDAGLLVGLAASTLGVEAPATGAAGAWAWAARVATDRATASRVDLANVCMERLDGWVLRASLVVCVAGPLRHHTT